MKKALFLILLLTVSFTSGCPAPGNENTANANVNANANQVANANANGVERFDASDKSVAIIIRYNPANGQKQILVAQDTIKLLKGVHKLRFHVFNNLDVNIKEVVIDFNTPDTTDNKKADPFEGSLPFKISDIKAGEDMRSQKRKAIGEHGTYPYKVSVFGTDGNLLLDPLDPQVEIVAVLDR